jgi:hypothetical protein
LKPFDDFDVQNGDEFHFIFFNDGETELVLIISDDGTNDDEFLSFILNVHLNDELQYASCYEFIKVWFLIGDIYVFILFLFQQYAFYFIFLIFQRMLNLISCLITHLI